MSTEHEALAALPEKYWLPDPAVVSLLPKGGRKDAQNESCSVCGGWHKPGAIHLDYVGHADLTRTLIEIDPDWDWEPFAIDEHGLPRIIKRGDELVLWGWLTILNKRRIAVGNVEAGKHDADKELVGDLLRNGAMRFGIYGGLWSKADRTRDTNPQEPQQQNDAPPTRAQSRPTGGGSQPSRSSSAASTEAPPSDAQKRMLDRCYKAIKMDPSWEMAFHRDTCGRECTRDELTKREMSKVIDAAKKIEDGGDWPDGWTTHQSGGAGGYAEDEEPW